jgi:hypothetical protein
VDDMALGQVSGLHNSLFPYQYHSPSAPQCLLQITNLVSKTSKETWEPSETGSIGKKNAFNFLVFRELITVTGVT